MKLIQELSEAISRNDKLKAALEKAITASVEKYKEHLEDGDEDKIKAAIADDFNPNITKLEIAQKIKAAGVAASTELAQSIIQLAHKFDAEANRA